MRRVERGDPPAEWQAKAEDETEKNKARVASGTKPKKDGAIYGAPKLKLALNVLFLRKCAYCEGWLGAGWDVEHFRPAKRVKGLPKHTGYWWLAYEWTNLYPACVGCNQSRIDPENPELRGQGKLDKFPLLDEDTRAYKHTDNIANESRALLDPCLDNPDEHIVLTRNGDVLAWGGSLEGQTTIDALGLWRSAYRDLRVWALTGLLQAEGANRDYYLSDEAPFCGLLRNYLILNPS